MLELLWGLTYWMQCCGVCETHMAYKTDPLEPITVVSMWLRDTTVKTRQTTKFVADESGIARMIVKTPIEQNEIVIRVMTRTDTATLSTAARKEYIKTLCNVS